MNENKNGKSSEHHIPNDENGILHYRKIFAEGKMGFLLTHPVMFARIKFFTLEESHFSAICTLRSFSIFGNYFVAVSLNRISLLAVSHFNITTSSGMLSRAKSISATLRGR